MGNNTLLETGVGMIIWQILTLLFFAAIVYFIFKLYRRVMTYLDKSIKLIDKKLDSD